ncbi:glycosyltransferase family 2 protein [Pelomonas sp. KK5]|uniref:glycosyltransferase n=1 Tax=Pelomonas sp. KK5 TaxID=1855730 RepID=UPI00097CB32B|nr:glycosyltransferase family A protein [Pelomonas sp. KK5]
MSLASFILNNSELDFIRQIVGRFAAGSQVLEVVLSECRTLHPQDWQLCDYRLQRLDDRFELTLNRPSNARQFRLDILHENLQGLEMLTARATPLDDGALAALLKQRSIAFVGCARQCADAVEASLRKLDSLGRLFGRHEIHVFENDSTDGTAERVQALAGELPVRLIQETGLAGKLPQRTARLAYGRNALLEAALQSNTDYVCVADLDGVLEPGLPSASSFTDAFRIDDCWDAVFPVNAGMYYDIWALRHPVICPGDYMLRGVDLDASLGQPLAVHFAATSIQVDWRGLKGWLPVDSAFGGMGVYKAAALRGARYIGTVDGRETCEHVTLHAQLRRRDARLFVSPRFVVASHGQQPAPAPVSA